MANWIYEFERQVHNRGHEIAIIYNGQSKTYDQLNRQASSFANWVYNNNLKRIAMYVPNCYEFYIAQFGTLKAGASGVPVNYMFAEDIIEYVLKDSGSEAILVHSENAELVASAAKDTSIKYIITVGESPYADITLNEILAANEETFSSLPKNDDDMFNITYTSGTTGRPKGVIKSHRNMSVHIDNLAHVWKLGPHSKWLCAGPVYHTSGLESSSLPVLASGGTVISIKWHVDKFFEHVHKYKPDAVYVAGSMMVDIANYEHPEKWDLSSLKFVCGGGAPMNETAFNKIINRYDFQFTERLGMTEAGIIFVYPVGKPGRYNPREELPYRIDGSCGKPLYNQINFRLIDLETGEVKETGEGELQLKGDSLFKGYWNLPELTKNSFTDDGWYRTGDIIRIEEDRHVYHVRRKDEIIISGGENVSPRAIENAVLKHEDVLEAAVFALPHERWGQEVCLAVVTKQISTLNEEEVIQYCKTTGRLARYEVPKRIFFRDSLPKTPTGSVPRKKLTEEYKNLAQVVQEN
ncbi:class I adenylate-forming enzyme family protein [Alteribacillus sp. YIM 98480]|uniref:class I adenylate-forming enzyme family protein n=1 Tax=Alteribacillus sp. YIM 98480 TaxID=2606599 RepID=UPI00131CE280|nr:class I adenylate-forming enzyme family protein [Alteribacillus sp. YIM 98480]